MSLISLALIFPRIACSWTILDSSSLLNPKAPAIASCSILVPLEKEFIISWLLAISLVKPSISLVKAKNLALSKLSSLPKIASASNSDVKDCSISSNPPAILSTWDKLRPNNLALEAALANSTLLFLNAKVIEGATWDISCNTFLWESNGLIPL